MPQLCTKALDNAVIIVFYYHVWVMDLVKGFMNSQNQINAKVRVAIHGLQGYMSIVRNLTQDVHCPSARLVALGCPDGPNICYNHTGFPSFGA